VTLAVLCAFAFLAGFIDAIVGGGGLLQLPALLVLLPGTPVPTVLGTNKLTSLAGTSMAALRYGQHVAVDWHTVAPAALTAFVFSYLGSRSINLLNPYLLRPLMLLLLIGVAIYIASAKTIGLAHSPRHPRVRARCIGVLVGAGLGFYDGFFGPGTGSFLIFIFVGVFGFDVLCASAAAKVSNGGTNLASVIYFASTDHIKYQIALPMAACNVLGSVVGSRLAILKGSSFVRGFFLVIVAVLILRLAWDLSR